MLLGSISWSKKPSLVQAVPDLSYPAQAMRLGNKLNEALGVCSRWVLWDMIEVQERLGWLLCVVIMVVPGWFWLLVNQYIDHHPILIIMSQSYMFIGWLSVVPSPGFWFFCRMPCLHTAALGGARQQEVHWRRMVSHEFAGDVDADQVGFPGGGDTQNFNDL